MAGRGGTTTSGPGASACTPWLARSPPTSWKTCAPSRFWRWSGRASPASASSTTCIAIPPGKPYADPNELSLRVIAGRERVGLRIVSAHRLWTRRGGPSARRGAAALRPGLAWTSFVRDHRGPGAVAWLAIGWHGGHRAPQRARAAPRCSCRPWVRRPRRTAGAVHMHLAEQPAEIDAVHGRDRALRRWSWSPTVGCSDRLLRGARHSPEARRRSQLLGQRRTTVCACPTTERDLGDGVVPAAELRRGGAHPGAGHRLAGPDRPARGRSIARAEPAPFRRSSACWSIPSEAAARRARRDRSSTRPPRAGPAAWVCPHRPRRAGGPADFVARRFWTTPRWWARSEDSPLQPGLRRPDPGHHRRDGRWPVHRARRQPSATSERSSRDTEPLAESGMSLEPRELLTQLVAIDSVSARSNLPMLDHLEPIAEVLGFATERMFVSEGKSNLVAQRGRGHRRARPGGPHRHRSLRPGLDGCADPHRAGRERSTAEAACDTKGFIACALAAASRAPTGSRSSALVDLHFRRGGGLPGGEGASSPTHG